MFLTLVYYSCHVFRFLNVLLYKKFIQMLAESSIMMAFQSHIQNWWQCSIVKL